MLRLALFKEVENTELTTTLDLYEGAIFPMGSIHCEFNDSREPVVFIAASSSDDLNLSRTTQDFFRLNPGIVDADLGLLSFLDHINIAQFAATIPPAFALAANSCLDRCGIKY